MFKICLLVQFCIEVAMPDFEFIIISVKCPGLNSPDVCIALFYRPPSSIVIPFWIPFLLLCAEIIFLCYPKSF